MRRLLLELLPGAFRPGEKVVYVMAVDRIGKPPRHGKVYEVPNA
jgi:hypothetical protein